MDLRIAKAKRTRRGKKIVPETFEMIDDTKRKGEYRVGVFISENLVYSRRNDIEENELESLWIEVKLLNAKPILVGTFYRPPSSNVQYQSKIEESITKVCELNCEVIILGDFNFNMHSSSESKFINGICRQNSLKQMIKSSTRITETTSTLIDIF